MKHIHKFDFIKQVNIVSKDKKVCGSAMLFFCIKCAKVVVKEVPTLTINE